MPTNEYKTVAEFFEGATEPLRTLLLDNFNRKVTSGTMKVRRLQDAINSGISWSDSKHPSLFPRLNAMETEEKMVKVVENLKEELEYLAKIVLDINNKDFYAIENKASVNFSSVTFSNCQNYTIGNFVSILSSIEQENWKFIMSFFRNKSGGKRLMVIDINNQYIPTIEKYFDNIVAKTPYTSTNNSKMVMFIINVSKF